MLQNITDTFSEWRRDRGFTLRQCASLLEVDHAYLVRVLNGRQKPSVILLVKMTKAMRWEKSSHQNSHQFEQVK